MMQTIIDAIVEALTGAGTAFVQGFGAVTQIFFANDQLTFIGVLLIFGLGAMFIMMIIRWISSIVRGI